MALAAADLRWLRSYVGTDEPSDADLETRVTALSGDLAAVALEVLRERRATLLGRPADWSMSGDYRESWTKNLDLLDRQIDELESLVDGGGGGRLATISLNNPGHDR